MIRTLDIGSVLPSPESPPGMTASKSSKSSSFHSDDGSVLADVGHFEEIGLDDDTVTLKSPSQVDIRPALSKTPSSRTLAAGRTASKARPPFPSIQTNVYASNPRSTNLSALTEPPSATRTKQLTSPSSASLPFTRRHRSPSPAYSLNPRDPRDPSFPPKPRRSSWQTGRDRKSFTDLERECDEDDGDDIPDGLVLENVPLSPRPPQERTPSRPSSVSPSPDRAPKERVRSVGNGTPAVAQAQGSLRSPTWRTDGTPRSKTRANSWNAALAELNAEAKTLTEKLEEHAGEMEEQQAKRPVGQRPNTWNSSRRSADTLYDRKERVKSTPELPPLRKTNIMIDPLPISKEKEAVLSRTRPSWLPPKDPAEEKRHLKEYQKMMAASAKAEERREAARRAKIEGRDSTVDNLMHIWEKDVIPRWNDAIRERRTRELWWKGVAPRSRGAVWTRAIGNELGLSEASFQAALERAQEVEARVKDDKGDADDVKKARWFQEIRNDAASKTWEDLRIFDVGGPLHQSLVDVLSAYAMYRSDIGYVSGCNTIAALLLLNLPNAGSAFVALANVLNRPLPLSFYACDPGAQASAFNLVLQTLSLKSAHLHEHLTKKVADAKLEESLSDLLTAMFTGHLAIDEAARLWDVYVFEGDALLIRAAVAFLLSREMTLLGAKTADEVKPILAERNAKVSSARVAGEVGAEDKFMISVREAGKA
ncbi:Rab6 GTPase activating GAP [Fusarium albosuccineum]|uniref:Rab6 GTPase activating GAP n=1 Tax=Fusarium albosuccineum TaxID=1237068 RepID=A0A8H4L0B5_9HYPO|nr:Rab6 GTPase activating GAP [Fusarium albosuccineum]